MEWVIVGIKFYFIFKICEKIIEVDYFVLGNFDEFLSSVFYSVFCLV